MELQQQGNGQYAYGGRLYAPGGRLTGLGLLKLLGFNNYSDAEAAGFKDPSVFGLTDWNDELSNDFKWNNDWLKVDGISPELKYAIENGLYDPTQLMLTEDTAPWFEDAAGTGLYSWKEFHGKGNIKGSDKISQREFDILQEAYPHTLNGLTWHDGLTFQ